MPDIQRGFRGKLGDYYDVAGGINISVSVTGSGNYDFCCFGVDSSEKLSDENYMVFYNQTSSPNREIVLNGGGTDAMFAVSLTKLPAHIAKLVFTVSVDGDGAMRQIHNLTVTLSQGGNPVTFSLSGGVFNDEKAVIAIEIYKKDVWRVAAVGAGFNGGLSALLTRFGGEEEQTAPTPQPAAPLPSAPKPPVQPPPAPAVISLEKRLERDAPQLVSLAKPLKVSLEKHKLTDVVAQVALLIDISGSMYDTFKDGTVQSVIDKIVPLAMQFDDNGEFELWYFGSGTKRMPAVTIKNYPQAAADWYSLMRQYGSGTDLAPALSDVIAEYKGGKLPAYVLCITDGATSNTSKVKRLISDASKEPIFWQFIGIGKGNYGVLEELDMMRNRTVDNANFFELDDIRRIDNTELYSRMLAEFPLWLKEAKRLRILS
jgi:stress response protein SCP2